EHGTPRDRATMILAGGTAVSREIQGPIGSDVALCQTLHNDPRPIAKGLASKTKLELSKISQEAARGPAHGPDHQRRAPAVQGRVPAGVGSGRNAAWWPAGPGATQVRAAFAVLRGGAQSPSPGAGDQDRHPVNTS